jgi:acetyltransferase
MLRQAGAVVVDTIGDLIDAAHALSHSRLPAKKRPGVGVLTGQAGSGLLILDALKSAGVAVPEIAPATVARIESLLPPMTFMKNPVDTGRPEKTFGTVMQALAADAAIDAVLVNALYEPASMTPVEDVEGALPAGKPILFASGGTAGSVGPIFDGLEALGVATFAAPDRAARAMIALDADARARARRGDGMDVPRGNRLPPGALDEDAAKKLVETFGIKTPRRIVCADRAAAKAAFAKLGGPVVVKVLDPAITHKTEAGGVHVNVRDPAALDAALDAIDRIPGTHRYLVEQQAEPGVELIVGGLNDPSYGPAVLVGLGGIAAEALGDVAMRLAPLSAADAEDMLEDLRGKKLLDGFRGAPAANRDALIEAVVAVGCLMAAHPEIKELDLNPVRAYPDGVLALDAVVVIGS